MEDSDAQFDLAVLERLQDFVALRGGQELEVLAVFCVAVLVALADAGAINLLRREPRLESLLRRAVEPGAGAVIAAVRAPDAAQLAVDVIRDVGVPGAGSEFIGRDQPLDGRVEKADFRLRQIAVRV